MFQRATEGGVRDLKAHQPLGAQLSYSDSPEQVATLDAGVTHLNPDLLYYVQFFQRQGMLRVIDGANQMCQVKERGLCAFAH